MKHKRPTAILLLLAGLLLAQAPSQSPAVLTFHAWLNVFNEAKLAALRQSIEAR